MARSRAYAFRTPHPGYDYSRLTETMAQCRYEVEKLLRECGNRTPLHTEAQAVLVDIDGLGKLLPGDAAARITPGHVLHSTRPRSS